MTQYGPKNAFSDQLHAEKYRAPGEDFREATNRIAGALADGDEHFKAFRDIIGNLRFLPAGRVQAAMGATKRVTPYNCLAASTKILTWEYGIIEIGEAFGRGDVHVLDGNGEWVKSPINSFGKREVHEVRLTMGRLSRTILATEDHRWILEDGAERKTATLRPGMRVAHVTTQEPTLPCISAVIHGLVYGDGARAQEDDTYQLRLCGEKNELLDYIRSGATSLSSPPSYDGDSVLRFKTPVDLKSLPTHDDLSYLYGFLVGWMASDGCVTTQPEVILSCGEAEADWLERVAPIVGWNVTGRSALSGETNFGLRNKPVFNVRFNVRDFSPEDFLRSKHRDRIAGYDQPDRAWRVREVSKDPVGVVETYCPRVPTTDSFVLEAGIHTGQCYVSGTIPDSWEGIGWAWLEAFATMRMGGGIGYDFSTLRPKDAPIRGLDSRSSGPVSFMGCFDALCHVISSSGHRRGAQMGVMRIDHPDIERFIRAKHNETQLTGFNVSIAVTDEFMHALKAEQPFDLRFNGETVRRVDPAVLWEMVMRSTWDWAEPGVIFIDQVNRMNNLWYCEKIAATNPCGEQPLPPNGACLLGSFNLVKYVNGRSGFHDGERVTFNWEQFRRDIFHVVRAMDNVVDRAIYPLLKQEIEAKSKRRMGLGITGFANASEAMEMPYGSSLCLQFEADVLDTLRDTSYLASVELAVEKGAFPLFDRDRYGEGAFIQQLPVEVREQIDKHGIRNSHLTSIAPTGTISMTADNVSSGIEPVFAYEVDRTIRMDEGVRQVRVKDYGVEMFGVRGKTVADVTLEEHRNVLLTAHQRVDSSVSKTCNVPHDTPWEEFKQLYMDVWEMGGKGCTTYTVGGQRGGIMEAVDEDEVDTAAACRIDSETGRRECD